MGLRLAAWTLVQAQRASERSFFLIITHKFSVTPTVEFLVSMPEPATLLLLGRGVTGLGARSWLKRRARKR